MQSLIIYTLLSGSTVFLGGILAYLFNHKIRTGELKNRISHAMMSFGAGIILSAIALVLIPEAMDELSLIPLALSFTAGGMLFMIIDRLLAKHGGGVATMLAMLLDFIPESIALGAVFTSEPKMAKLLALYIGIQNLPEAFNAYREMRKGGFNIKPALWLFFAFSFIGTISALAGYYLLTDYPELNAHLMIFASGGILYLLNRDLIPESLMKRDHLVSMGAVIGFLVGIVGDKLI